MNDVCTVLYMYVYVYYSCIRKSIPNDISGKRRFVIKLKDYMNNFFINFIDRQTDQTAFAEIFGQIDTSEYYEAPELEGLGTLF